MNIQHSVNTETREASEPWRKRGFCGKMGGYRRKRWIAEKWGKKAPSEIEGGWSVQKLKKGQKKKNK